MEKKLARFTAFFTCIFSVFVCITVWFLPVLEQRVEAFSASIREDQRAREERYALLKQMSGLEILEYNTQQVQEQAEKQAEKKEAAKESGETPPVQEEEEEVIVISHQMQFELPKGANDKNVNISQNCIDQKIEIGIPGADANYIYDYQMLGKSEDIEGVESLDYFSESGSGKIVLSMGKIVEIESSFDKDYLYLDFLDPQEVYDRIVVVDAGHGGSAPGAVSGSSCEKDITLAIVQKIKGIFDKTKNKRIGVYYTRLDDSNPDFSERSGLANKMGADLFLSVHINSLKGHTDVEGVEVLYDELAADTEFDTRDFAQICLDEVAASSGARKRSLKTGNKIYVIRNSNAPAALAEVGFMNNPNELARLLDASYQQKIADGLYQAVIKSLDRLDEIEGK